MKSKKALISGVTGQDTPLYPSEMKLIQKRMKTRKRNKISRHIEEYRYEM